MSDTPTVQERPTARSEELLRSTISMLCHFIWHRQTRPGDHVWSIPVDQERDFDCILTDAVDELVQLRLILKTRDEELTALKVLTVQQGEEIAKLKAENERLRGELDAAEQHVKIAHEASEREHEKQVASALLVTTLQEALKWLVHLHHDVGKAGDKPEAGEWEAAIAKAIAALAAVPPQEPQA